MKRRVTQADVALRAGVHATTVSMALRNHPSLPPATRQRIVALAEEMGYKPDPTLGALVAYRRSKSEPKTSATIAYVTHWITRFGWRDTAPHAQFFAGATERAPQLGYNLEHFWMGEPGLTHRRMSDILSARGITGVIVASHLPDISAPLEFDWDRLSAVRIDFHPHEPRLHSISNDQYGIIRLAMDRVMSAGYRRIGFVITEGWDKFVDLAWSAGYYTEQRRLAPGERIPILYYSEQWHSRNSTGINPHHAVPRDAFEQWFSKYRPEVVISCRDFIGSVLEECGLSVPADVAYVDLLLQETDARVAGVRENCRRVGELAVELLAGQLQQHNFGIPEFSTATLVQGSWFDGATLPRRSQPEPAPTPAVAPGP